MPSGGSIGWIPGIGGSSERDVEEVPNFGARGALDIRDLHILHSWSLHDT